MPLGCTGDATPAPTLSTLIPMGHRGWIVSTLAALALLATACGDAAESAVVLETTTTAPDTTVEPTDDTAAATETSIVPVETDTTDSTEAPQDTGPTTTAPQAGQGTTLTDAARISTLGLGPVYMGDTLAEVTEKIGVELSPEELGDETCRYYVAPGGPPGVRFMVAFDRIARVDVDDPSVITTRSGAGIGSTKSEIIELFGDKIVPSPHPYSDGEYLTFVPEDEKDANLRIIFETNTDGVVVAFRTGQLPEVDFIEGCL